MFVDTIVDDIAGIRDLYVSVKGLIGYVPGRVGNGSGNFLLKFLCMGNSHFQHSAHLSLHRHTNSAHDMI